MQGDIKNHFWVFVMTWPGIEPRSPGPLANILTIMPMDQSIYSFSFQDLFANLQDSRAQSIQLFIYTCKERLHSQQFLNKQLFLF